MSKDGINSARSARGLLTEQLRKYMIGPLGGKEERIEAGVWRESSEKDTPVKINQRPSDFYHLGILYPMATRIDPEEDDADPDTADVDSMAPESIMALANAMRQSAMGCTIRVADASSRLKVSVSCGVYELELEHSNANDDGKKGSGDSEAAPETGTAGVEVSESDSGSEWKPAAWKRRSIDWEELIVPDDLPGGLEQTTIGEFEGVDVVAIKHADSGGVTITITLVNRSTEKHDRLRDPAIYQSRIELAHPERKPVFRPLSAGRDHGGDEYWNHELLFRKTNQFAAGHGCSVIWDTAENCTEATSIRTSWIPEQEVFKASSEIKGLSDSRLFELDTLDYSVVRNRTEVLQRLAALPECYEAWIGSSERDLGLVLEQEAEERRRRLKRAAVANLDVCRKQLDRIWQGIEFLREDEHAWHAFTLANTAMRKAMEKERPGQSASWFPFQLAFMLLSLPSVAHEHHDDREILDLIWFPTGGGKTEAYLGLAAFTIFYRRLAFGKQGEGTAVLTRYTLRFLTSQQFERAAQVVLACELVRRENDDLGDARIDIGLYVGGKVTPNWLSQAENLLSENDDGGGHGMTTLPVSDCPWCASRLRVSEQVVSDGRLKSSCPSESCPFHEELPLVFVDEEIFGNPPSFIVATIDKFALLPWRPEAGSIFGVATGCKAPSLIIQDELHLINDSLGSLAGLYESAIDLICERVSARPKIIGSTATIRRAEEQARALFDRDLLQFPPSGIDVEDSFFFREDKSQPGRLYLGIHAQGRSPKHTQPIVVGLLLQFSGLIEDDELRDPFHTLVVYFNSLRELGGAFILVEDDVPRYLRALQKIGALPVGMGLRRLRPALEISGSVPSDMIKHYAENLKTTVLAENLDREPEDIVLATNMISVGVDVGRLGAMVVVGQPKTTSEYIQASSRVGRARGSAGLVATIYNWSRPRDRSHYENFCGYHEAFYRHVEAQSVTPFASRARDRGLHAALFALARILIPELLPNDSPAAILESEVESRVRGIMQEMIERISTIEKNPDEIEEATSELEDIIESWKAIAAEADSLRPLVWSRQKDSDDSASSFTRSMIGGAMEEPEWDIQFSMRDVDAASPVVLKG